MSNIDRNPTTATSLILTPSQHAEIRACLTALMEYAAWQRDVSQDVTEADREQAHMAAMTAADALDLLDTAAAEIVAMVREVRVMDWASRVDGSVKH
jgi:hypothetical protein